jgi:hypothetical protein
MQIQVDEVRKENVIIKRSNIQLAGNLEDAETRLVEIQLNLESSHANDSSVAQGGETEMLKIKIGAQQGVLVETRYPKGSVIMISFFFLKNGVCIS